MISTETREPLPALYVTLSRIGPLLAVLGIAGWVIGLFTGNLAECMHSYLFGWIFWVNVALGCFVLSMLANVVRANWGYPVLRPFEAGSRMLWLMLVLMIPIFIGLKYIYPWMDPAQVAADPVMKGRAAYMSSTWFILRAIVYFVIWLIISTLLNQSSLRQDTSRDLNEAQWRVNLSAPGIVIYVLTVTFAMTDWLMSLDSHWFSTIYGFIFCDGQILGALSLIVLMVTAARHFNQPPYNDETVSRASMRDLGNLMLTFTMVWAYFALSQWIIIWSGNLTFEGHYYWIRLEDPGLLAMGSFIVFGQFFFPFLLLLSSKAKRTPKLLGMVAAWILFVRIIDIFWMVKPMFLSHFHLHIPFTPWDVAAFFGIGGLWLTGFVWALRAHPILPRHNLTVQEVLEHA